MFRNQLVIRYSTLIDCMHLVLLLMYINIVDILFLLPYESIRFDAYHLKLSVRLVDGTATMADFMQRTVDCSVDTISTALTFVFRGIPYLRR